LPIPGFFLRKKRVRIKEPPLAGIPKKELVENRWFLGGYSSDIFTKKIENPSYVSESVL